MTNEEKAKKIVKETEDFFYHNEQERGLACALRMAKWKEQQMMELWNVARNVYEAWMGGTMNDVRECMKDLGHVYDEFKDKGMKGGKE